jgi:hypothetical protein
MGSGTLPIWGKGIALLANTGPLETSWDIGIQRAEIAGSKYLCAPLRQPDFLTSALRLLVVFRSTDLTRERLNGGERRGKERALSGQRQRIVLQ